MHEICSVQSNELATLKDKKSYPLVIKMHRIFIPIEIHPTGILVIRTWSLQRFKDLRRLKNRQTDRQKVLGPKTKYTQLLRYSNVFIFGEL